MWFVGVVVGSRGWYSVGGEEGGRWLTESFNRGTGRVLTIEEDKGI